MIIKVVMVVMVVMVIMVIMVVINAGKVVNTILSTINLNPNNILHIK